MKFVLDDYQGDYVMLCRTKEESEIFLNFLADHGRKWSSGISYREVRSFGGYADGVCYALTLGSGVALIGMPIMDLPSLSLKTLSGMVTLVV